MSYGPSSRTGQRRQRRRERGTDTTYKLLDAPHGSFECSQPCRAGDIRLPESAEQRLAMSARPSPAKRWRRQGRASRTVLYHTQRMNILSTTVLMTTAATCCSKVRVREPWFWRLRNVRLGRTVSIVCLRNQLGARDRPGDVQKGSPGGHCTGRPAGCPRAALGCPGPPVQCCTRAENSRRVTQSRENLFWNSFASREGASILLDDTRHHSMTLETSRQHSIILIVDSLTRVHHCADLVCPTVRLIVLPLDGFPSYPPVRPSIHPPTAR
jgi:hypothetical protein